MLDQSSDFQNKLRAKTVTKDFCSQNNQLYIYVFLALYNDLKDG